MKFTLLGIILLSFMTVSCVKKYPIYTYDRDPEIEIDSDQPVKIRIEGPISYYNNTSLKDGPKTQLNRLYSEEEFKIQLKSKLVEKFSDEDINHREDNYTYEVILTDLTMKFDTLTNYHKSNMSGPGGMKYSYASKSLNIILSANILINDQNGLLISYNSVGLGRLTKESGVREMTQESLNKSIGFLSKTILKDAHRGKREWYGPHQ